MKRGKHFLISLVAGISLLAYPFMSIAKGEGSVKIGSGWSNANEASVAVEEAVTNLKKQMQGATPDIIILFSTVGYDVDKVLKEVNAAFPSSKIIGETSCAGVMTNDGFISGEVGSLALLGISSSKITFGVGSSNLDDTTDPKKAAKEAMLKAISDAGKKKNETPDLILLFPSAIGDEENLIVGIEEVFGKGKVPIFGGAAADNTIEGKWKVFANTNSYARGIVVCAVYSDVKIGFAFLSGFSPTDKKATVTKAKGRVIVELNHRPAGEVYNEWLNGRLTDKLLSSANNILLDTNLDPLGIKKESQTGLTSYLLIHPKSFPKDPKYSLEVFANVKRGDEIYLMEGSPDMLVERGALATRLARSRGRITQREVSGGIVIYCAGTMLAIPKERRNDLPLKISKALGGAPFIGAFTFGEQGYFPGIGNLHGNLMASAIVFGGKK